MSRNYSSNEITRIFNMKPNPMNSQNEGSNDNLQEERTIKEIQNISPLNHPYFPRINNKYSNTLTQKNPLQNFIQQQNFDDQLIKMKQADENLEGLTLEDIVQKQEKQQNILLEESKDQNIEHNQQHIDSKQCEEQDEEEEEEEEEEENDYEFQYNQNLNSQRNNMTDELGNFVFHQQAQQDLFIDKLNKLTTVFEQISSDMKIQQYIEPEELLKIRNILNFLQQIKSKIEDDENNSSLKQAYIQELQSFISGFGDHKNYNDYYQDLYLQAVQREKQAISEQQNQQQENLHQSDQSSNQEQQANEQADLQSNRESFSFRDYIKNCILKTYQSIQGFMKNPLNILRCLLLALTLLFFSSYFSIPDMTKQPPSEIFNWLAYNRESRMLVVTGGLSFCSFILFGVRQLYITVIGAMRSDQEKAVLNLYLEQNPILHISIIYMTDPNIIPQKFDLAVWLCFYFTFSTFKIFHSICSQQLKMILQNINDDYQEELRCIKKIQRFSAILFLANLWICAIGLWTFSMSGYYKLSLLFYEGILFGFDSFKIVICTTKLCDHMNFYVNYNTEEIHDPFFKRETLFDSFQHIVQLFHFIQLIYNYFFKLDYQFIMHLWLLYLFKKINISLRQLKNNFQAYRRYRNIQLNLDIMFPKVDISQLQSDDVCSICHDELIVARRIETCGHKFHIKCLFKWLKSQQNSRCPICRSEIPNLNFDNIANKPGIFTSAIDFLARFLMPTINFIFEPRAPQQNENQGGNNQNDENENNNNQEVQADDQQIDQQQNLQNANGQENQLESQINNNLTLQDILNQNLFEGDERDVLMYQHLSQLIAQQNQDKKVESESKEDELQQLQAQRQSLRENIFQIFKQRMLENQNQKDNSVNNDQNKQAEDDEEYEDEEEQEGYENFEFNEQGLHTNLNEYDKEMYNMSQTKEQLLNLQNEFLSLQDIIMQKDSNIDTELVLKQFQQRLEREQSKLINFLMNKIIYNEEQGTLQDENQIINQEKSVDQSETKLQNNDQNMNEVIKNNEDNQISKDYLLDNLKNEESQHSEDAEDQQKQGKDEEEEKFSDNNINSKGQIQLCSNDQALLFDHEFFQHTQLNKEVVKLDTENNSSQKDTILKEKFNNDLVNDEIQKIEQSDEIQNFANEQEEVKQSVGENQMVQDIKDLQDNLLNNEKTDLNNIEQIEYSYQTQFGIDLSSQNKQQNLNDQDLQLNQPLIDEGLKEQNTETYNIQNDINFLNDEKIEIYEDNIEKLVQQQNFNEDILEQQTHIDSIQQNQDKAQHSEQSEQEQI
ncbi:C3HC4 type (RING finger) zinc finger protein (macronuclear) [Tetrahymena thermophila SB210]|uniref:C3HC4 type (RING finger) zinc finger protein n=1 Tax=Tetrahymena thermophila (strain SB210) TaxID=312017 RepID=I7M3Z0_TETTS|nr:C3HC4 type (RING finger) zinc finger protein [Tetrahymena thermophila SB210]EAS04574.2 C3HC4 type (RING finger) zinc finger protein [Tetrahymena thermophila SB210]|eukprot:XP_001024819.2 C3HC4 type (RING finger) zinc finger protein [Tetrahymena thermophila SB210]